MHYTRTGDVECINCDGDSEMNESPVKWVVGRAFWIGVFWSCIMGAFFWGVILWLIL